MDLFDLTPKTEDLTVELKMNGKDVTNPDGTPMTITVMSPFSANARKVLYAMQDERVAKAKERGDTKLSAAEIEEMQLETLVRTTVGWDLTWKGEKVEFTPELAKEVFTAAFWIRPLIEEAKASTLDFMKP